MGNILALARFYLPFDQHCVIKYITTECWLEALPLFLITGDGQQNLKILLNLVINLMCTKMSCMVFMHLRVAAVHHRKFPVGWHKNLSVQKFDIRVDTSYTL